MTTIRSWRQHSFQEWRLHIVTMLPCSPARNYINSLRSCRTKGLGFGTLPTGQPLRRSHSATHAVCQCQHTIPTLGLLTMVRQASWLFFDIDLKGSHQSHAGKGQHQTQHFHVQSTQPTTTSMIKTTQSCYPVNTKLKPGRRAAAQQTFKLTQGKHLRDDRMI